MSPMRRLVCGLIVLAVAPLGVTADKPAPAEKRFALPAGESLVIKWSAGWTDMAPPPSTPPGTVSFAGPDSSKMRVMLVPMPPNPKFTGEAENLRISRATWRASWRRAAARSTTSRLAIEGPNVRGFYVKGVDHKPKPGEFSFIYAGPLSISSRPYVFQILWNTGGETAANAALAALKSVRIQ